VLTPLSPLPIQFKGLQGLVFLTLLTRSDYQTDSFKMYYYIIAINSLKQSKQIASNTSISVVMKSVYGFSNAEIVEFYVLS
jgi:hypothetical protein